MLLETFSAGVKDASRSCPPAADTDVEYSVSREHGRQRTSAYVVL